MPRPAWPRIPVAPAAGLRLHQRQRPLEQIHHHEPGVKVSHAGSDEPEPAGRGPAHKPELQQLGAAAAAARGVGDPAVQRQALVDVQRVQAEAVRPVARLLHEERLPVRAAAAPTATAASNAYAHTFAATGVVIAAPPPSRCAAGSGTSTRPGIDAATAAAVTAVVAGVAVRGSRVGQGSLEAKAGATRQALQDLHHVPLPRVGPVEHAREAHHLVQRKVHQPAYRRFQEARQRPRVAPRNPLAPRANAGRGGGVTCRRRSGSLRRRRLGFMQAAAAAPRVR